MTPEDIHVTYADTDHGLNGTGPGGSRYTVMIAGAIAGASGKIKRKLMKVASSMLEAAEEDLELADGAVRIQGSDRSVSIAEIALQAHYFRLSLPDDVDSGLDASHVYDHPYTTMPSEDRSDLGVFYPIMGHMCHIPVIEVDAETGKDRVPGLRGGARLRHRRQPHDARGPRARRDGPGDRLGRLRALLLRRVTVSSSPGPMPTI